MEADQEIMTLICFSEAYGSSMALGCVLGFSVGDGHSRFLTNRVSTVHASGRLGGIEEGTLNLRWIKPTRRTDLADDFADFVDSTAKVKRDCGWLLCLLP